MQQACSAIITSNLASSFESLLCALLMISGRRSTDLVYFVSMHTLAFACMDNAVSSFPALHYIYSHLVTLSTGDL